MLRRLTLGAAVLSLATSSAHALTITPIYEPSWANAPMGATADVQSVINDFQTIFTNPVNISIQVGWGDVANTFDLKKLGDLGAAWFPELFQGQADQYTLTQTEKLITDHANAHPENAAINTVAQNLPTTYPNPNGRNTFFISDAEYKALTGFAQNKNGIDGYVGFLDLAPLRYGDGSGVAGGLSFKGVVEHEVTHAMGRFDSAYQSGLGGGPQYLTPLDFFKYDCSTGTLNPSRTVTCFSIDGGRTFAAGFTYNASADTSDWNNRPGDPFNLFASTSTTISLTDLVEMQALGWDIAIATAPEPGTLVLLGTGLIGLLTFHRYGRWVR